MCPSWPRAAASAKATPAGIDGVAHGAIKTAAEKAGEYSGQHGGEYVGEKTGRVRAETDNAEVIKKVVVDALADLRRKSHEEVQGVMGGGKCDPQAAREQVKEVFASFERTAVDARSERNACTEGRPMPPGVSTDADRTIGR